MKISRTMKLFIGVAILWTIFRGMTSGHTGASESIWYFTGILVGKWFWRSDD